MRNPFSKSNLVVSQCRIIRSFVAVIGSQEIRKRLISGIEKDFKEKVAKDSGTTVESLIAEWLNEPEAMALFRDLDMGENHLRLLAEDAIKAKVKCLE